MKLCVLGSGSKGNATLVYTDSTALLVDAGFTCKQIEVRLESVGFDPKTLTALLVTHEHSDHVRGAAVLGKRYGLPVYMTKGTAGNISEQLRTSCHLKFITPEMPFTLGDIEVTAFSVPHDTSDPVAFLLGHNGRRAVILTDIGSVTVRAVEKIRMAHLALVESNHDPDMLRDGPYPWFLKERVSGKHGHLSNGDCAELLAYAGGNGLKTVIFGHLSQQNNSPELVRDLAKKLFDGLPVDYEVASQDSPTKVFEV